jgi:hypothetical protein
MRDKNIVAEWNGDDVKNRADKLAKMTAWEIGLVVQAQAKLLAPVKTGRLRGSIQTASGDGQRTKPEAQGGFIDRVKYFFGKDTIEAPTDPHETFVGTPVEYGPHMEYGTIKTSAQPFLRPALDIAKGRALTIVEVNGKKAFAEYLTTKDTFSQTNEAFSE